MSGKKNIAIACNPLAASGKAHLLARDVAATLSGKNIKHTIFDKTWPERFDGFTDIFIVGGDGTLNYFVNHYPGIKLPLVVFKGGTGNDFHWMLYGDKSFEAQTEIALNGTPKPIDLGKCNEHYFLNEAGIGFEGVVVKALTGKKKKPGKTSFLLTILKKIFSYRSAHYTIHANGQQLSGRKLLVDVSNGRRAGGGFFIAPESKADDGLFDVVMANALTAFQRLRYLPVIEKGKHLGLHFIQHTRTTKVLVESDTVIQYHLDGEYHEAVRLEIDILPAQLRFRY